MFRHFSRIFAMPFLREKTRRPLWSRSLKATRGIISGGLLLAGALLMGATPAAVNAPVPTFNLPDGLTPADRHDIATELKRLEARLADLRANLKSDGPTIAQDRLAD